MFNEDSVEIAAPPQLVWDVFTDVEHWPDWTSSVTSLVGLFCCGLPSILGLILGIVGMRETKRTGQDGYAIAVVGTIIGGLAVAGWVVYLLLSIGIYATGWQWAP